MKGQSIPTSLDKDAFRALPPSKAKCHYCGRLTYSETVEQARTSERLPARRTKDHVRPKCFSGIEIVLCCEGCNNTKGNSPAKVFSFFVAQHAELFRHMQQGEMSAIKSKYDRFLHDLTLAGFLACRALAVTGRSFDQKSPRILSGAPVRAPNGRFTKRDLKDGK